MEQDPFPELQIQSSDFLDELSARSKCSKCQKSRKFYCYTCYLPVPEIADRVPVVKLPLKIDIIKHPGETDGKSTAVHAGIISHDDVTIYTYPCIPDYDKEKVVLVFPNETSKTLDELAQKWKVSAPSVSLSNKRTSLAENFDGPPTKALRLDDTSKVYRKASDEEGTENNKSEEKPASDTCVKDEEKDAIGHKGLEMVKVAGCPLERVVFIDSTWNQTRTICNDERLKDLQCIELRTQKTKFWRHQKDIPDTYLSTIEAIYYFLREFQDCFATHPYNGQFDNLLFFFKFMYSKIRTMYNGGDDLRAYKSRKEKLPGK